MTKGSGYKFVNLVTALPCTNNKQSNRHGNTAYIEGFSRKTKSNYKIRRWT